MAAPNFTRFSMANNQFSIDLYKHLIASKPREENGFLSPFSVTAALSMINVGARGNTREQILIATGLKHIGESTEIDNSVQTLFSKLNIKTQSEDQSVNDKKTRWNMFSRQTPYLVIANRIYIQENLDVKAEFGETLNKYYSTKFGQADFENNAEEARNEINRWVVSVTNNRIKNLFNSVEEHVRLVLVSAIYFKAEWEDHFPKKYTAKGDFFRDNGQTFRVPFMEYYDKHAHFATFADLDATGLLKSYVGGGLHMLVILPNKKDGLSALEEKLNPELFDIGNYQPADVCITLPKFEIKQAFQLKAPLQHMGIVDAFAESADFSGISDTELMIGDAVHKVFIEVDEKGTEAAAATGIKMEPLMSTGDWPQRDPPKVFTANHPFLFAIQHRETGTVLFIGRVSRPDGSVRRPSRSSVNCCSV